MAKFLNYTPHTITMNDGTTYPPVGLVRIEATYSPLNEDGISHIEYGEPTGLPEQQPDTYIIVSAVVLSAIGHKRTDLVAPATGHSDCIRKDGFIVSVPCFIQ